MLKATVGVVFFGTPHRGSSLQSLGHIIAGAASVGLRSPNTQLLDVLRTDSQYLEPQRKNFVTISSNLSIVCIREEVPTYGSMVSKRYCSPSVCPLTDKRFFALPGGP